MPRSTMLAFAMAVGAAAAVAVVGVPRDAHACGGCFVPIGVGTQVTTHRMAFAISARRTILWDQIVYTGSPSSFAWVLPIHGVVDVGVSSDQFFQRLDGFTTPRVVAPPPPPCNSEKRCNAEKLGSSSSMPTSADKGGVDVTRHEVVGPYEATQLSATDSAALKRWLTDHGYSLPASIAPVIDQYLKEGFGFLAIKLVPGQSVTAMQPIRIAYDGSSPVLPLRMIAAGTGANVGLELFVLGEGRWETKNFPATEVETKDLVWDFAAAATAASPASNFRALETAIFAREPRSWITETSDELDLGALTSMLPPATTTDDSGKTTFSPHTDESELHTAFPGRLKVTTSRLFANLPSSALATDLELQASLRGKIPSQRIAPSSINYVCPAVEYVGSCDGWLGCSTSPQSGDPSSTGGSTPTWLGMGVLGALGFGAARRRTRRV